MATSNDPHEARDSVPCEHPSFTYTRGIFECSICHKEYEPKCLLTTMNEPPPPTRPRKHR